MRASPRSGTFSGGRSAIALLVVLFVPMLAPPAAAAASTGDLVEVRLAIAMDTPSSGRYDGNFSFLAYTLNGTSASADGMRIWLAGPDGPVVRENLESKARSMFADHFRGLFPDDTLVAVSCLVDNSSLAEVPGTDEFHPPLEVRAMGVLAISPLSFGLPASASLDALAPLVLADGAELHREIPLSAPPGHRIELSVESFAGSFFNETGSRTLRLELDNSAGTGPSARLSGATLRAAAPRQAGPDSLRVNGTVDIPDLSTVRIRGSVEFCRADPSGYWAPPAGLRNLGSVSGATLSELVRSGVLPAEYIYEHGVLPVQAALQARLSSALNISLAFAPDWSTSGNLTCTVSASSAGRPLFGLQNVLVLGALRAGAAFVFSIPVDVGWPVELEFLLPVGLRLDGMAAAPVPSGRPRFFWNDPDGIGNISASLSADRAPRLAGDDVRITVAADFSEPLADTARLLFEGSADVPVKVDVRVFMGAVAAPEAISSYLPENLTIRFITADLLRLLLSERVIGQPDMDALLREVRPRLESAFRSALGQSVLPEIRFVPETLEGYDLDRMDGSRPVVIHAWASGHRTKHIDLFKAVSASPGPATITQDFAFTGVAGWNVTFRMRFSAETRLLSARGSGVKPVTGREGGRDYFEVAFGPAGGRSNVTAVLEPSPSLLLRSLGPVCLPAIVMLAVAAVLVSRRLRRRRLQRKAAEVVEWDDGRTG